MAVSWQVLYILGVGCEGRRKSLRFRILEAIKFPLIKKEYLLDVVARSPHVLQDEKGLQLYEEAINYHYVQPILLSSHCMTSTGNL
jgi:hypothetical protein